MEAIGSDPVEQEDRSDDPEGDERRPQHQPGRGRAIEAEPREHLVGDGATDREQGERDEQQRDHEERPERRAHLAGDDVPRAAVRGIGLDRPACRGEPTGRAGDGGERGDDGRHPGRALCPVAGGDERVAQRPGDAPVEPLVDRPVDAVRDRALGGEQQRDHGDDEEAGEDRLHRVVRERRRAIGAPVPDPGAGRDGDVERHFQAARLTGGARVLAHGTEP